MATMAGTVECGLLGPLCIKVSGTPIEIRAQKVRIIAASLLLHPNRVVSIEEIVDRVWDNDTPGGVRRAIHTYVNRLRSAFGPASELIRTAPTGYQITLPPRSVDLGQWRDHIVTAREARTGADLEAELQSLRDGLALWRGRALMDVQSSFLHLHSVPQLEEERIQALERLNDVELALGRAGELVGRLRSLTSEHPLREPFWYQLMLAQYRSNGQAAALETYSTVSTHLREELGIDPGERLQELHRRILIADPDTLTPLRSAAAAVRHPAPPFQIPPDVANFVGREDLIDEVCGLLGSRTGNPQIVLLTGPPGVGKTALAIHVAHTLRALFPDGQLYVNLRGFSSDQRISSHEALNRCLYALGVTAEVIPLDLDERCALLRSLLIDRRILIVLDNVADAEQARPLLAGGPDCRVVATSQNNLHGLVARDGAHRVPVDPVSPGDAVALLDRIMKGQRVAAEPRAAAELADVCGYLPLALRIVATQLAAAPRQKIASALQRLAAGHRLTAMAIDGDGDADVLRAFEVSYQRLEPELARLFCLLGRIPGLRFDKFAVANLTTVAPEDAQRMLERLAAANLIYSHTADYFQFHDLIGEYALARTADYPEGGDNDALVRLFAFYVHGVEAARDLLYPATPRPEGRHGSAWGPVIPEWDGPAEALDWFDHELENLFAAVQVTDVRLRQSARRLSAAVLACLRGRRHSSPWEAAFAAVLDSSEQANEERRR